MTIYSFNFKGYVVRYAVKSDGYFHWSVFDGGIPVQSGKSETREKARKAAQKFINKLENSD